MGGSSAQPIPHPVSPTRAQREQIEKERLMEEKRASERMQHAQELRRQVRENQQKLVQDRIATFEEGRRLKEEAQRRSECINNVKKKKIEELRYPSPLLFRAPGRRKVQAAGIPGPQNTTEAPRGVAVCTGLQQNMGARVLPAPWDLLGRMLGL